MATMVIDTNDDRKTAKSALRDALRAKLKTGSSYEEGIPGSSVSSNSSYEDISSKLIDVETLCNESDDSGLSDEHEEKETSSSNASNIPIEERRLRNRLAARKCREKRKNRITNLEKICNNLENRLSILQSEIDGLDGQKKNLTRLLENHTCVRRLTPKPTAVITNSVLSK